MSTNTANFMTLRGNIPRNITGVVPVYMSSTNTYSNAIANTELTCADALKTNQGELLFTGAYNVPAHGYSIGNYYFLSQTVAGAITTTRPTSGYCQDLFFVLDAETLLVNVRQAYNLGAHPVGDYIQVKPSAAGSYSNALATLAFNTVTDLWGGSCSHSGDGIKLAAGGSYGYQINYCLTAILDTACFDIIATTSSVSTVIDPARYCVGLNCTTYSGQAPSNFTAGYWTPAVDTVLTVRVRAGIGIGTFSLSTTDSSFEAWRIL